MRSFLRGVIAPAIMGILITAVFAPGSAGGDEIKKLIKEAEKGEYWYDAILELGEMQDARAVKALITILESNPESRKRQNAAGALGEYDGPFDPAGMDALMKAMVEDDSDDVRWYAAGSISRYYSFGDYADPKPLPALKEALSDSSPYVRSHAVQTLQYAANKDVKDGEYVPLIIDLLENDPEVNVRQAAALTLGAYGDSRALEALISALKDEGYLVRGFASRALGELGDKSAAEYILPLLKDENETARSYAADALKALGVSGDTALEEGKPREALDRFVAELQGRGWDDGLRKKIIDLVPDIDPPPAVPEEAMKSMARGKAAFKIAQNRGDYEEARDLFSKAADLAPWRPDGYFNLALVQEKLKEYDNAIGNLKMYLYASPGARDADSVQEKIYELEYLNERKQKGLDEFDRAAALWDSGQEDEAEEAYRSAIEAYPELQQAHADLGGILYNQKRYEEAVKELREAIRLGNDNLWTYVVLAISLNGMGESEDEQIRIIEEGIKADPMGDWSADAGMAFFNLGAAYGRKGDNEKAVEYYQKAADGGYMREEALRRIKEKRGY